MGLIPGWGTKIPHAVQCGQDKKKKKKKSHYFLKNLKLELPYDPAISLLVIYLEKTNLERYMHPNSALFTIVKTWKEPM